MLICFSSNMFTRFESSNRTHLTKVDYWDFWRSVWKIVFAQNQDFHKSTQEWQIR